MKYSELLHLKFHRGFSTQMLMELYPNDVRKISHIALMDLDKATLEKTLKENRTLSHLMRLKSRLPVHCSENYPTEE